ncbi:MAG: glycosyltransferase family 4 protein [Frankiaceae bacterium]
MTSRTSTKHVLAIIDGLGRGGAEMLLADFAIGVPAAGLRLSVAYLRDKEGSPAADRLRSVEVEPLLFPITGLNRESVVSVQRGIERVSPDIVHTHLGYSDLLGGLAAKRLDVPAFSTIHLARWEVERRIRDHVKLSLMAQVRRRYMHAVLSVSQGARLAYLDRGWDRPEHVVTVHNGVARQTRLDTGRYPQRFRLSDSALVLGMVSVLRPGKGHTEAIEALRILQRANRDIRLLIVGDGPSRDSIEADAADLGDAVVFIGFLDDVMPALDVIDILVHPSHHEAFPTALLEAMSAGVPIIATAVGGVPEIVLHGETGVLVSPPPDPARLAAAIQPVVEDESLRERLGDAARARFAAYFTAEAWAGRVRDVYDAHLTGGVGWRTRSGVNARTLAPGCGC